MVPSPSRQETILPRRRSSRRRKRCSKARSTSAGASSPRDACALARPCCSWAVQPPRSYVVPAASLCGPRAWWAASPIATATGRRLSRARARSSRSGSTRSPTQRCRRECSSRSLDPRSSRRCACSRATCPKCTGIVCCSVQRSPSTRRGFPLADALAGVEDISVSLDPRTRTFFAELLSPGPTPADAPRGFFGAWMVGEGLVLTAIAAAPAPEV